MEETYDRIPVSAILPSPYQYRRTFDGLDELAASIRARGVLSPIRVRPKDGTYELVFGERRLRASAIAGVEDIPAIIVELTDDQVIEEQLFENLQRADVHPLEEGEHYHKLIHEFGYTLEMLLEKTKRSKTYVYSRMKLTQLAPGVKKALLDGKLLPAIAELIGRIGDPKLQDRACKDVLGLGQLEDDGVRPEGIGDDDAGFEQQPLSYRAAAQLIRRRYALRLELAKFNIHDVTLTEAGACTTCEHRSGNQPELPGISKASKADDLCTNPPCFEKKTKAAWDRTAQISKDSGLTVVEGKDAAEIFDHNDQVSPSAPYVDPKAELPPNLAKPGSTATWAKLLGKKLPEIPFVVVQDPSGAPIELLDKAAATKVLRELGKVEKPTTKPHALASKGGMSAKAIDEREQKRKLEEVALAAVLGEVATAASKDQGKKELACWRWMARSFIEVINWGDADMVAERRGVSKFSELSHVVDKARTAGEVRGLIVEILICFEANNYGEPARGRFKDGLQLFGVDWDKALGQAKEAGASAKCDATDGSAKCVHESGHDGLHSNRKRTWGDKTAKKGGR